MSAATIVVFSNSSVHLEKGRFVVTIAFVDDGKLYYDNVIVYEGRDVFLLQCGLIDMGFNCGMPDGDFCPLTLMALNELKSELGLEKMSSKNKNYLTLRDSFVYS